MISISEFKKNKKLGKTIQLSKIPSTNNSAVKESDSEDKRTSYPSKALNMAAFSGGTLKKVPEVKSTDAFKSKFQNKTYDEMSQAAKLPYSTDSEEGKFVRATAEQHATSADWKKKIDEINDTLKGFESVDFASMPANERENTVRGLQKQGEQLTKRREEYEAKYRAAKYTEEYPVKYAEYLKLLNNDDFEKNSAPGTKNKNAIYNYINNIDNYKSISKSRAAVSGGNKDVALSDKMNPSEIKIFNYLYNTQGKKKAQEYFDFLKQELEIRSSEEIYEKTKNSGIGKIGVSFASGNESFEEGIAGVFDKERPVTALQLATSKLRENTSGVERVAFDVSQSVGNMLPSIAAGFIADTALPGSSAIVGSGTLGLSSAGNAYQSALREGRTETEARAYSTLVGASEAGLQYVIGGISKLGGKAFSKLIPKLNGIENAFLRISAKYGSSMIREGVEEGLQEFLTPVFESVVYNEKYDAADAEDIAYSALLGAITGMVFESGDIISSEADIRRSNKLSDSLISADTRNTINSLNKKSNIVKGTHKIMELGIKTSVLKSDSTKQTAFDTMSEQNITPSGAMEQRLKDSAGSSELGELGLDQRTVDNIEMTIDKLDTAFASSWYGDDAVTSAKKAAETYAKGAAIGDAVSAAAIANRIIKGENVSEKTAKSLIKKASDLLPSAYMVDIVSGTSEQKAARIIDAAADYVSAINERVSEISENYAFDIVEDMKSAVADTNAKLTDESRAALADLVVNANVNTNLDTIIADADATAVLSRVLGMHIDSDTKVLDVKRKVKNMLSTYKAGQGTIYSSMSKSKNAKMNSIEHQLISADLASDKMLTAFRNAVYNGKLTEKQAKLIASYEASLNIFNRATAGKLDTKSTVEDIMNAAGLVAGFDMSGEISSYYDNGIVEVTESDKLPSDSAGLFDSETGTVVINKKAELSKKLGYRLAKSLMSDVKQTYDVEYDFGVTQKEINAYVDASYNKENVETIKKYAKVSSKLISDVSDDIDIHGYTHVLRDNDIRHINNSHGNNTNEKYPITDEDIKKIPMIVENYDKVFVKTNSRGIPGIVYVKVTSENIIYYLEAATEEYNKEKLLVNKQMIKTGIENIPNLYGLISAINKKESSSQYLADLRKIRKAYVQDVKGNYSINSIPNNSSNVNIFIDSVLNYITEHIPNSDSLFVKAANKYRSYIMEHRGRLNSSMLSANNLNKEAAADFLTELFTNTKVMNDCAKNDLEFMTEVASKVKDFAEESGDSELSDFANDVYRKMFDVMNNDERASELQAVLMERREKGMSTEHFDSSFAELHTNFEDTEEETLRSKAQEWYNAARRGLVDSGEAIDRLAKKTGNKTIYHMYNNVKQSKQAINYMLTKVQVDIEGNKLGESLKDIFKPILKDNQKYKMFCEYVQHLNNAERALNDKAIFTDISREQSISIAKTLEARFPEFKHWAEKVYKYNDGLLKWQLDSGLISYEQYQDLKASNKYYVPAFVTQNNNVDKPFFYDTVVVNKTVKRAKGGADENLMPLLDALELKTSQVISEARTNLLANEIVETLRKRGQLIETPTGYEVEDPTIQEFINCIVAVKNSNGFPPQKIDGKYVTPMAQRTLKNSLLDLFEFGSGNKNSGRAIISEYAKRITLSETFNADDATMLLDKLSEISIISDGTAEAPYYQYPELRARLADAKVYVSPAVLNEIPDYNHFRKSAFKKLQLTTKEQKGGISIDTFYQELSESYPELFASDITNPTDQLVRLHEVATETLKKPNDTTLEEYYGKELDTIKNELRDKINELSIKAIKDAATERAAIIEDENAHAFVTYDNDSTNNLGFGSEQEGNRMAFYIDGIRYNADIGRGLYEGLKSIDAVPEARAMWVPLQKANTLFKKLVTSYNPFFSIRNGIRDLQDAVMYSSNPAKLIGYYLPKAYKEIATNGEMWQLYQSLGGVGSSYFDFKAQMNLEADLSTKSKAKQAYQKTVNIVEFMNQAVEQAPRLAEFMLLMKNSDGSYASKLKALYGAADVTVNFGRSGIYSKFINSTLVPFFNPAVQGASRFVRMFTETKGVKSWIILAGKLVALGFSFGAINDLLNGDDEEYEQLTDYQKQNNILIRIGDGRFIKIPKGRSLSVFSIGAQNIIDTAKGKDVDWIGSLKTSIGQIAPNNPFTDNLAAPFLNALSNKTWYGGDIESKSDENVEASQRYDETTDYLSRWIGSVINYSPKKIHYILDSYSGVLGDYVLPILTPKGAGNIVENILLTAGSNFIVDSKSSNRVSSDYYSLIENLTYEKNDINIEDNTAPAVALRFMNSQTKAIRTLYSEIQSVNGGILSPNEKAEKSRELKATIAGIMLNAMEGEKSVYEAAKNIESKYAFEKEGRYYDSFGNELTKEAYLDAIYIEVNRKVFGAEYALKTYNQKVYEKASESVSRGATYDLYFDTYFATQDVEGDIDYTKGTIKTGSARKNKWDIINSQDASSEEKAALASVMFDISADKLLKANLAAINNYDYIKFVCDTGVYSSDENSTKREKTLNYINNMSLSTRQKDALYKLAGYSEKTIGNVPWR